MTADYVAFHAEQRPDAVAILDNGRAVTYGEFARDIRKFTHGIRELGVPEGGTIAVGSDDLYVQWLILLACERLGIATASVISREEVSVLPLLAGVDLLLSEFPLKRASPRRRHALTPAWVESVLRLSDAETALPQPSPEATLRILRTSGTTGAAKRIRLTRRMAEAWLSRWIWCYGLSPRTRLMLAMPFVVGGIYAQACAVLRAGGTVVREGRVDVPTALSAHAVSHIALLPLYLRNVLEQIPAGFGRLPGLVVSTFGGAIPPSLREEAVGRLCGALCDMYGCNEVGFIGSNGLHHVGRFIEIWPGVAAEVVDEQDRPLPRGEAGRIRVRTESMFSGYVDDPETTRQMLRDGWFYPGDVGVLHGARELELLGRADDLLNIGGVKIAPERLEEIIRMHTPLKDVAVGAVAGADGAAEICVAVADAGIEEAAIWQQIDPALALAGFRKFSIVRLARIPRNLAGKIQRNLLRAEIAAVAAPQPGPRPVGAG
jgi:acyl-coenzyme A synthetase/AMP-(fatty) acid ligase